MSTLLIMCSTLFSTDYTVAIDSCNGSFCILSCVIVAGKNHNLHKLYLS